MIGLIGVKTQKGHYGKIREGARAMPKNREFDPYYEKLEMMEIAEMREDDLSEDNRALKKKIKELKRGWKIIIDLIAVLNAYEGGVETISNQGQAMDGYSALANFVSVAKRAKELKVDSGKIDATT